MDLLSTLSRYKIELILAGSGLFFIILGGVGYLKPVLFPEEVMVLSKSGEAKVIMVDISGAVNKPDVYRMTTGDRIQDLLDRAGGLTDKYDAKWVEVNLNRAKKVSDGEKVYIPSINDQNPMTNDQSKKVNINAAKQSELEAVAGIGTVTAEKIIKGRPYQDLAELVSRKIISPKLYSQTKDLLSVW